VVVSSSANDATLLMLGMLLKHALFANVILLDFIKVVDYVRAEFKAEVVVVTTTSVTTTRHDAHDQSPSATARCRHCTLTPHCL